MEVLGADRHCGYVGSVTAWGLSVSCACTELGVLLKQRHAVRHAAELARECGASRQLLEIYTRRDQKGR